MDSKQACSNFLPSNLSSDDFTLPLDESITIDNEKFILPPCKMADLVIASKEKNKAPVRESEELKEQLQASFGERRVDIQNSHFSSY